MGGSEILQLENRIKNGEENLQSQLNKKQARIAKPGEFTERAFLNNKIDLTQAEAVADLIFSSNTIAAKAACASLQGKFSTKITELINNLVGLRAEIEAAIDFPEDEIPKKSMSIINDQLGGLISGTEDIVRMAKKGVKLNEQYTFPFGLTHLFPLLPFPSYC